MLREVLRSTLYSSRRPFSSKATRRSSFSTLITILFPVLREERPKIFRTLSSINLKRFCDRKRNGLAAVVHRLLNRQFIVNVDGARAAESARAPVDVGPRRAVQKS